MVPDHSGQAEDVFRNSSYAVVNLGEEIRSGTERISKPLTSPYGGLQYLGMRPPELTRTISRSQPNSATTASSDMVVM